VESPFQLLSAVEWAHAAGRRISIAMRLSGPQMEKTAAELLRRGAPVDEITPWVGIPRSKLSDDKEWLIGDGFSGQFRMVASVLKPKRIVLLDDGANTLALADALLDRTPFRRPRRTEGRLTRFLGDVARHRMQTLAGHEALELFTVFPLGEQRVEALSARGIRTLRHDFGWTRDAASPIDLPSDRILLGSARPTDGLVTVPDYLRWVSTQAQEAPVVYLPHRRELPDVLAALRNMAGVEVLETGLPVELVLAGIHRPLEFVTLQSSAATTLELLLAGTGSEFRESVLA